MIVCYVCMQRAEAPAVSNLSRGRVEDELDAVPEAAKIALNYLRQQHTTAVRRLGRVREELEHLSSDCGACDACRARRV